MKLNDTTRFSHPVLWTATDDFSDGEFSCTEIRVEEELTASQVTVHIAIQISHPDFLSLITMGQATAGVIVECADTYLEQLLPLSAAGGSIPFEPGALSGRVVLRPAIWSKKVVQDFHPKNLHPEFGKLMPAIGAGTLLALADELVVEVGRDKLAPLETIFELSVDERVPEGEFQVDIDGERIRIVAGSLAHRDISGMRNSRDGRAVLLSSVYMPALMAVIHSVKGNTATYEGRRWHRIFVAKAASLGIDLESCEALVAAQQFLKSPFSRTAAVYRKGQE
jgi:hypothetical protein